MTPTQQEMQILRKYAAGGELTVIAKECDVPVDDVTAVAQSVGWQRQRAAELLRQHESALIQRRANRETAVHVEPRPDTIEQRLLRAEAIPRLQARAARIRGLLDDLSRDLEGAAKVAHAEAQVERLRTELANAVDALRQVARPAAKKTAPAKAATLAVDHRAVRAWAAANKVTCSPHGRIPTSVVDAYHAAQVAA